MTFKKFLKNVGFIIGLFCIAEALAIEAPVYSRFLVNGIEVPAEKSWRKYSLIVPEETSYPFSLEIRGPFGGTISGIVISPAKANIIKVREGIIKDKNANPQT